jgi:hypothetical protein
MNRSEVINGIQSLRYFLEKNHSGHPDDLAFYDDVLCECRMLVLQNEANDPHSPALTGKGYKHIR